jgi:hypothetical protein
MNCFSFMAASRRSLGQERQDKEGLKVLRVRNIFRPLKQIGFRLQNGFLHRERKEAAPA